MQSHAMTLDTPSQPQEYNCDFDNLLTHLQSFTLTFLLVEVLTLPSHKDYSHLDTLGTY